jgi:hypothetical protein
VPKVAKSATRYRRGTDAATTVAMLQNVTNCYTFEARGLAERHVEHVVVNKIRVDGNEEVLKEPTSDWRKLIQ